MGKTSRLSKLLERIDDWFAVECSTAVIVGFIVAIVVMRLLMIFTNINNLYTLTEIFGNQMSLAHDVVVSGKSFAVLFEDHERYLPPELQFHGLILVNNILLALLAKVFGYHYYLLPILALFYELTIYLCFVLVLRDRFGDRAAILFSLLFLFAPRGYLCSGLNLMGSHPEGLAFIAVLFYLVLHGNGKRGPYLALGLFGTFFFLYKGVILALIALAPSIARKLPGPFKKMMGAVLLAAGFIPWAFYFTVVGFHSQFIEDTRFYVGEQPATWWSAISNPRFLPKNIRFPDLSFSAIPIPLYALFVIGCLVYLTTKAIKRQVPDRPTALAIPAFFAIFWAVLVFGNIHVRERYYILLYPFVFILCAMALSLMGKKARVGFAAVLLVLLLVEPFILIRPGQGALFLHYRGLEYGKRGINYLAARDVDKANHWIEVCPENHGVYAPFMPMFKADFGTYGQTNRSIDEYILNVNDFLRRNAKREDVLLGFGFGLRNRFYDDAQYRSVFARLEMSDDARATVQRGAEMEVEDLPCEAK